MARPATITARKTDRAPTRAQTAQLSPGGSSVGKAKNGKCDWGKSKWSKVTSKQWKDIVKSAVNSGCARCSRDAVEVEPRRGRTRAASGLGCVCGPAGVPSAVPRVARAVPTIATTAERRVCVRSNQQHYYPSFYELVGRSGCNLYDIRSAYARMAVKRGHTVIIHPCVDSAPAHARIRPRSDVWLRARRSLLCALL